VVTNSGTAPASITGASVTGVHAADFALQSSACTGISLPVAGTCTVIVGFTPSTFGPRFATLTVGSAATSATADLSGTGLDVPQLRLLPNVFAARGLTSADGTGFPANTVVQLQWTGETAVFEATTDADGHFTMRVNAPADGRPGRHTLQAIDQPDAFSGVSADGLIAEASARPPTSRNPGLVGLPALVDR
jgi:hypothetical protein